MAQTEQKNSVGTLLVVLAIVAVLGVITVSSLRAAQPVTINTGQQNEERNYLSVSGTHELQVMPDEATITFSVVTTDASAQVASDKNREIMTAVQAALRKDGLSDSEIETVNVYLSKQTEWDYTRQRYLDKGYQQTATVKITTEKLELVGKLLDTAVAAGANNIQDVSFGLTPASEAEYKEQALTEAAKVAKRKAQLLADASGATLGKITSLSESSYNYMPYYANSRAVMAYDMAGAEKAPTPISPEKVSISVTVNIGYELN